MSGKEIMKCPECGKEGTVVDNVNRCIPCEEKSGKVYRDIGKFRANGQEKIQALVNVVAKEIYKITEEELTRIYPEKNWYQDNFSSNLFSIALQVTSSIQEYVVQARASSISENRDAK